MDIIFLSKILLCYQSNLFLLRDNNIRIKNSKRVEFKVNSPVLIAEDFAAFDDPEYELWLIVSEFDEFNEFDDTESEFCEFANDLDS